MARRSMLRAADHDREAVAERLRKATVEGRLLADELEERLGAAFSARTYGELDALVSDLPWDERRRRRRSPATLAVAMLLVLALIVMVTVAVFLFITGIAFVMVWIAAGWWVFGRRHFGCGSRRHGRGALYGRSAL